MAPAAEDDGRCWWCCDCGDDETETCPHPVDRCPACEIDDAQARDFWDYDDDDEA
jgi:hypothetical protein